MYSYECKKCSITVHRKTRVRKDETRICQECSRKIVHEEMRARFAAKPKKIHIRICSGCGDEKEVTSKHNTKKKCKSCSSKGVSKPRQSKRVEKILVKKMRDETKQHKKEMAAKKEPKAMSPEAMREHIDNFYKENTVVHHDCKEMYGVSDQRMRLG